MSCLPVPGIQSLEAREDTNDQLLDASKPLDMEYWLDKLLLLLIGFCCICVLLFICWMFAMMESSAALAEATSSRTPTNSGENKTEIEGFDVYIVGSTTTAAAEPGNVVTVL